ncbi:hypothetical protein [Bacillus mycoides]|uniref:hypothetical protein n=1 Tax=Bacillus mycoides TaxID=1405 RepID=UPI001FB4D9D7|nr:hypothetical protein [Bacillus mycoides]UNP84852.1 hypothetical protein MN034_29870 [Bacillus mycoides]
MSDLELLRVLLVNSKSIRDEQSYRAHTYGILMTLLLSTEVFKNNKDIQPFLEENKISFKPYVFDSRTQIVGKICRIIESLNIDQLKQINTSINQIAFNSNDEQNKGVRIGKKTKNDKNYFDSLLEQFERKKS